jgi:hypothetical protein
MSRDPLHRDAYSHRDGYAAGFDNEGFDNDGDDTESNDAVNDEHYGRSRPNKRDILRARRRVEALLEERRLRRAIDDDWADESA